MESKLAAASSKKKTMSETFNCRKSSNHISLSYTHTHSRGERAKRTGARENCLGTLYRKREGERESRAELVFWYSSHNDPTHMHMHMKCYFIIRCALLGYFATLTLTHTHTPISFSFRFLLRFPFHLFVQSIGINHADIAKTFGALKNLQEHHTMQ